MPDASSLLVLVSTYTDTTPETEHLPRGILAYSFDVFSKRLTLLNALRDIEQPSFMALASNRRFLYAVNETVTYQGQNGGSVSAFRFDESSGRLTLINVQPTHGKHPCYISLDKTNRWAFVANYSGGNFSVFPIQSDGSLGPAAATLQHVGHGSHPQRQEAAHAHCIMADPTNRFLLVADLGINRIVIYRFDAETGSVILHDDMSGILHDGAGPRHLAFHPALPIVYCVNELDNTIVAYEFDGKLKAIQSVQTLPENFTDVSYSAEVHIDAVGEHVYAANRGHDSIVYFRIDASGGKLSAPRFILTDGHFPRHFTLDSTGRWLFVGNQKSNTLRIFEKSPASNEWTPLDTHLDILQPVCIQVLE